MMSIPPGVSSADWQGTVRTTCLPICGTILTQAQGLGPAGYNKDFIEERMTREQIAEAQRLSREWFEAHPSGN